MYSSELFVILMFVLPTLIWFGCFISVLNNNFQGSGKLVWLLVVMFIPFGCLAYMFIGRGQRLKGKHEYINAPAY